MGPQNEVKTSSVQLLSCDQLLAIPWTAARQASQSNTNCRSLLKIISIALVMPSHYLIHCHPLLLLPSIFPSIRVFSNESTIHIRWPKYWVSASASVLPMNNQDWFLLELTGLISLLSEGLLRLKTPKNQHHNSKASVLQHSAYFIVQLSHPYMTTGKTIGLTRQTFVGKVTLLLFNILSRLVIAFLPRSQASFNFMAAVTTWSDLGA